jgi:hypothetical protein
MKVPTLDERAMQWANNNNKSDGFVILDPEFNITGWCKSLENNANTFVPGCTGIGLNGEWFMTRGGDAYNGAKEWIQFKYVTKKKGRPATGKAKSNAERMKEYRARKAESKDKAFDAMANKLAMTERALLSSQVEVKRLYEEIAELNREIVKLSKKPKKGFL